MINKELKPPTNHMKEELKTRTLSYITAGFGLVAGLAWNDAIGSLIEFIFPLQRSSVLMKFLYAVVITGVLVAVTFYLARLFKERD